MPIISNFPGSGKDGAPGKSAFQSAQEAGYTGSEAEFYAALVALKDGPFLPKPTGTAGQVLGFTADNVVEAVDRKRVEVMLTVSDGPDGKKVYTLDKTYDEILGYINSGREVVIEERGGLPRYRTFLFRNFNGDYLSFTSYFMGTMGVRKQKLVSLLSIRPDNTTSVTEIPLGAQLVVYTPGSTGLTSTNVQAAITEVNKKTPKATQITLTAAGWDSSAKTQSVTVTGVLADESKQLIMPMPAMASQNAYATAGIACIAQAADGLTFKCLTVPTEDIMVYVAVQGVA